MAMIPQKRRLASRMSTPALAPKLNTIASNPRQGLNYTTTPAKGGVYHTYANGQKVFVRTQPKAIVGPTTPAPPVAPKAPAAPAAPTGTGGVQAPAEDPRDAQYYADLAQDTQQRQSQLNELQAQDENARTAFSESLRRYREQLPRQQRAALNQANSAGLAESSVLNEQRADNEVQAVRGEADMTSSYNAEAAARQAAREALMQGASIAEASRLAEAAGRRAQLYQERADEGSLALNETDSPAAAPAAAAAKQFKTVVKNGKVYHYYPDGRKVYVRPASKR